MRGFYRLEPFLSSTRQQRCLWSNGWKRSASPSGEKRRYRASPASCLRQALYPEPGASAARRTVWKTRREKAAWSSFQSNYSELGERGGFLTSLPFGLWRSPAAQTERKSIVNISLRRRAKCEALSVGLKAPFLDPPPVPKQPFGYAFSRSAPSTLGAERGRRC